MKYYYNIEQRSEEWYKLREGKITGSKLADLMTKKFPNTEAYKLLNERLGGEEKSDFKSSAMQLGIEAESVALDAVRKETKLDFSEHIAFIDGESTSCSPDGVIEIDKKVIGVAEVKVCNGAAWLKNKEDDDYWENYKYQLLNYFFTIPTLKYIIFGVYNPSFGITIKKIERSFFTGEDYVSVRNRIKEFEDWYILNSQILSQKNNPKKKIICPSCGKERTLRLSEYKNLKSSLCRKCNIKDHKFTYVSPIKDKRLYQCWKAMKCRVYSPRQASYKKLVENGTLYVCKEWAESYANFELWALENDYADNKTLDRIDNKYGYEPFNCRWATDIEQAINSSTTKYKWLIKEDWISLWSMKKYWGEKKVKQLYDKLTKGKITIDEIEELIKQELNKKI